MNEQERNFHRQMDKLGRKMQADMAFAPGLSTILFVIGLIASGIGLGCWLILLITSQ